MIAVRALAAIAIAAWCVGCQVDVALPPEPDSGPLPIDAEIDAGIDAEIDAGIDAGIDAAFDASPID